MFELKLKAANERSGENLPATVKIAYSAGVHDLKRLLQDEAQVPIEEQKLVFNGKLLKSGKDLQQYGIKDQDTIVFLRSSRSATTAPATSGSGNTQQTASNARSQSLPQRGRQSSNSDTPFGDMLSSFMDNPALQSMMNDPNLIRSIMENSPQMRAVLEANPHLNHILNDPQLFREQMEAMRNPAVMQEMLRTQDRALSNIESHPGGYNALRRMYQDVHEPMMNATAGQRRSSEETQEPEVEQTQSPVPNNAPIPNPFVNGRRAPGSRRAPTSSAAAADAFRRLGLGSQGLPTTAQGWPFRPTPNPSNRNPWSSSNQQTPSAPNPWATAPATTAVPPSNPWAEGGAASSNASPNGQSQSNTNDRTPYSGIPLPPSFLGGASSESMSQRMQDPMMQQMLRTVMSDPAFLDSVIRSNPALSSMMDANPEMRAMLTNPQFTQAMQSMFSSPEGIAGIQSQLEGLGGLGGFAPGVSGSASNPGESSSMLAAAVAGARATGEENASLTNAALELRFARQLAQLESMGFTTKADNLRALSLSNGNVDGAIDHLVSEPSSSTPGSNTPPST